MGRRSARRGLEDAAGEGGGVAATGWGARLLEVMERPVVHACLVAVVVLLAVLVRLPHAYDEARYFTNHPDEATYFNQAYAGYLAEGGRAPLAHSGSGFPLFLEQVFRAAGVAAGPSVQQMHGGPYGNETTAAARLAYLADAVLGAAVVPATYWLAVAFLRPAKALLASLLVVFDPFLLFLSGHLMSEQMFAVAAVLAFGCAVRARRHPAWLLPAGGVLAFAAMARGNGVFLVVGLAAFAVPLLRSRGRRGWGRWVVASAAVFFLVLAPYLSWRAESLPGPFDYGTNTRMFADGYWDFSDRYWQGYSRATGGPKETLGDYFRNHTLAQAADRLYRSLQFQVQDVFGGAIGHRPHPEGTILGPFLAIPVVATLLFERSRRELWFFPAAALATMLPFAWSYHLHDSPRYLVPLVPLGAPLAVEGMAWLARRLPRPDLAMAGYVGLFLALFAVHPLVEGLAALGHPNPSWGWTFALTVPPLALAVAEAVRRTRTDAAVA